MNDSKLKEIVDFALTERIKKLEQLCNDHSQRNNDLTRRLEREETRVADLAQRLVTEGSNHAVCVNERNTLRARVAELESAEEELKTRLAAVTEDRNKTLANACDRGHRIDAAMIALKS